MLTLQKNIPKTSDFRKKNISKRIEGHIGDLVTLCMMTHMIIFGNQLLSRLDFI